MKILAVYPYVPYPLNRGAYHRAYHLLKALAQEHEVHLFALAERNEGFEHKKIFADFCQRVQILPFQHPAWQKLFPKRLLNPLPSTIAHWTDYTMASALSRMVAADNYDAVHILDLVLVQYFMNEHRQLPLVLDRTRVDLQYQLMERKRMNFSLKNRLLNYENYAKLWAYEKATARRCALEVVCGPDDEDFIRRYISRSVPIAVIPNGVDLEYFSSEACHDTQATEPTLIFCGAMDYNPNIDAMRWYFSEMHDAIMNEVPEARLLLVGKDPGAEMRAYGSRPEVTVTGGVPDVRPYYKNAWIQIVPLRIGGGTRLKIVESLGIGTPVVSTQIGAQGLGLVHEQDILYADSPAEFIKQTTRALRDAALRKKLQINGLAAARARLSWKKMGASLNQAYTRHIGGREAPVAENFATSSVY